MKLRLVENCGESAIPQPVTAADIGLAPYQTSAKRENIIPGIKFADFPE